MSAWINEATWHGLIVVAGFVLILLGAVAALAWGLLRERPRDRAERASLDRAEQAPTMVLAPLPPVRETAVPASDPPRPPRPAQGPPRLPAPPAGESRERVLTVVQEAAASAGRWLDTTRRDTLLAAWDGWRDEIDQAYTEALQVWAAGFGALEQEWQAAA